MYNYISGKLVHKEPTLAVIETNGIGFDIKISLNTSTNIKVNELTKLYTYLHIQDTAFTLYGFKLEEEKVVFLSLTSVSGVGAATALMLLSFMSVAEIRNAILKEDVQAIKSIKGIGLKTAQRVILELKGKLPDLGSPEEDNKASGEHYARANLLEEALYALLALGIPKPTAQKNIKAALNKYEKNISSVEDLVKFTLKQA